MNQKFLIIVVSVILVLPMAAYIFQFGLGFWQSPSEWSDLGGYIGGVYTPILALLTLTVLCGSNLPSSFTTSATSGQFARKRVKRLFDSVKL